MMRIIDLAGYKLIENETKNTKTYIVTRFGNEEKKIKTLKEAIEYIYIEERKYMDDFSWDGFSWKGESFNDKTN